MNLTEKSLKLFGNHSGTNKSLYNELLEKTDFVVKDGLFQHHVSFFHESIDGCFYYMEFFGNGWNKRKPNKDGWIKYLNALAYNVYTGEMKSKREIFGA